MELGLGRIWGLRKVGLELGLEVQLALRRVGVGIGMILDKSWGSGWIRVGEN